MGRRFHQHVRRGHIVSVSALSDHLMGLVLACVLIDNFVVSVSALSDHLMGPPFTTAI